VKTLAEHYGICVNSEDPLYLFSGDMKDVTDAVARTKQPGLRIFVPRGGHLEAHFAVNRDGWPADVRSMLQSVLDAANAQFPFAWRLDEDADCYTFVPTKTRDAQGHVIDSPALLDRKIDIPAGYRRIYEHAELMSKTLSAQTGFRVGCCQGVVAGIPWGMQSIDFEAHDEPARSVLRRLIRATGGRYYYLERCDPAVPGRQTWCAVNLIGIH